jgi:predicted double-glycine peptidase
MDNLESDEMEKTAQTETETIDEIVEEKQKETTGVVIANDNYSCGPASLATALNRNGLNLSLNEVSKHTNTSLNGTSMQSLIDAAKYYGFSAYGVEVDTQGLKENNIVHLNINGCEHWTVISKLTDTHIFLADSTEGNINFTLDEFNSYFSKKAIIFANNSLNDLKNDLISNQITILNKDQCLKISGKGLKKKVVGYRIVWKYGWRQKYGWILRPKVVGGHVSFTQWVYVKGYHAVWGKYKVKEPIYKYYFVSDDAMTSAKIKK